MLLSFYPFVLLMVSFCRNVLHWPAAVNAIYLALQDYFPGDLSSFIHRNVSVRQTTGDLTSMFLLLVAANGIFEPLEVAFNRAWGVARNRSYLRNQLVALGLIFVCGGLALLSLMLTALNGTWIAEWSGRQTAVSVWMNLLFFKLAAVPISILALFLVYWLLPNRKIDPTRVAPAAILVGMILEALKYGVLLLWPLLQDKLSREYDIFRHSVTILLWSFITTLVVLAGAEWSARRGREDPLS